AHPGPEVEDATGDLPCRRVRGQGGRSRPCRGGHVVHPQRAQIPEILQGRAHNHAARVRVGKSLRVSRSPDAGGGVRLGLLCLLTTLAYNSVSKYIRALLREDQQRKV